MTGQEAAVAADETNVVHLAGRVSAVLDARVLPSGDTVVPLRVVVPRATSNGPASSGGSRATVDVIDVACWSAATRRVAGRLEPGDHVEVDGSLHRRFFRGGSGVQSRYEVAARRLSRSENADTPNGQGRAKASQATARGQPAESGQATARDGPRPPGLGPATGPRLTGHG